MAKGLHWSENDLNKLNDRQENVRLNQLRDEVIAKRGVPKAEKQRRTTFKKSMDELVMKPSKYRNIKCEVDGYKFDSKREAEIYGVLKLRMKKGEISELELQRKYPIIVDGQKICNYFADFNYKDLRDGKYYTVDVKGMEPTPVFKLKAKLLKAVYGITITIVK